MIAVILANDSTLGINPKGYSASAFRIINLFILSLIQQETVEPTFFINIGTHNFTMIINAKRHGFPGTGESDGGIRAFREKKSRGDAVFIKLNADDMTTVVDPAGIGIKLREHQSFESGLLTARSRDSGLLSSTRQQSGLAR